MARFILFVVFTLFVSSTIAQINLTEIRNKSIEVVAEAVKNLKSFPENLKNATNTVIGTVSEVFNETSLNSREDNSTLLEAPVIKDNTSRLLASPILKNVALGEKCHNDTECKSEGASCISEICSCKKGYVLSFSKHSCLPTASNLDDTCSEDQQCLGLKQLFGETACVNFKCSCASDHKLVNGKCIGHKVLGIMCTSNAECQIANTVCRQGICACVSGTRPNPDDNLCLPEAKKINDTCSEPSQCDSLGEAQCREGICVCKPLTHLFKNKCINIKALGEECDENGECEVPEEKGKRGCVKQKCSCIIGTQDEDICKGSATSLTAGLALVLLSASLFV